MPMDVFKKAEAKIRKLEQVARELRAGEHYQTTRLTSLKSLCRPWENAAAFAVLLAHRVRERYEQTGRPRHLSEEIWVRNRRLIQRADAVIAEVAEDPALKKNSPPRELLDKMKELQNKTRPIPFGVLRLVDDFQMLIMEKLLACVLADNEAAPHWAYEAAAAYADRYTPSQGSGLTRESAPLVEELAGMLRVALGLPRADEPVAEPTAPEPAKTAPKPKAPEDRRMVYTLRVEVIGGLHDFDECVRVIEIPEEMTLLDLHYAIQRAVHFDNDHLFDFYVGRGPRSQKIRYGGDEDYGEQPGEYSDITLREVYPLKNMKLYYLFDYGDEWLFEIRKLRGEKPVNPRVKYPRVIEKIGRSPRQYQSSGW